MKGKSRLQSLEAVCLMLQDDLPMKEVQAEVLLGKQKKSARLKLRVFQDLKLFF